MMANVLVKRCCADRLVLKWDGAAAVYIFAQVVNDDLHLFPYITAGLTHMQLLVPELSKPQPTPGMNQSQRRPY